MLVYTVYWYTIVVSYYDDTNDIYDDSNHILLILYIIILEVFYIYGNGYHKYSIIIL